MSVPAASGATLLDRATGTACVVTGVAVTAGVVALDASVRVAQRFRNPLGTAIEAVYMFPLPPLAAVTAMRATLGGRTVMARLKERGQARRDYAEAVATGRRAALAEEERPSTFTMTVGNLGPGEEAEVVLEMVGPVEVAAHLDAAGIVQAWDAVLRLPTVVAPRYTEGHALGGADVGSGVAPDTDRVPDASRVTPPTGVGVGPALEWSVRLEPAGLPLGAIEAPDGADRVPGRGGVVVVSGKGMCDEDVTVRWKLAPTTLTVAAAVHHDEHPVAGGDGVATVSLTIVPPVGTRPRPPADVVIALDRSGSMEGWKMGTAISAARRLLDTLTVSDRVGVVAFDTSVLGAELGLLPLTGPNRERLHEVLASVTARGGTELTDAIVAAGHLLGRRSPGRERLILLVTDAQVSGEQQAVAAAQATGARFVVVGVDTAVNHGLLERLGSATGGSSTAVASATELDRAVDVARHRLGAPALEHLAVHVAGQVADSLAGEHRDAVWPDAVARLGVRITQAAGDPVSVTLAADGPSGSWRSGLDAVPTVNPAGRLTWARHRLRALEDDFDGGSATRPDELVGLSLAHGVLCRFTAFVAVDDRGDLVGDGSPPVAVVQRAEVPRGWALTAACAPADSLARAEMAMPKQMNARSSALGWSEGVSLHSLTDRVGPALAPPSPKARGDWWAARPTEYESSDDAELAQLVTDLHDAITHLGSNHHTTRAALGSLLNRLSGDGLPGPAIRLLTELVERGCDLALMSESIAVLAPGGAQICRLGLRTGDIALAAAPAGSAASLRRRLARHRQEHPVTDDDVALTLALMEAVSV